MDMLTGPIIFYSFVGMSQLFLVLCLPLFIAISNTQGTNKFFNLQFFLHRKSFLFEIIGRSVTTHNHDVLSPTAARVCGWKAKKSKQFGSIKFVRQYILNFEFEY